SRASACRRARRAGRSRRAARGSDRGSWVAGYARCVGEPVAQDKLQGRRLEILDWLPVNAQRAHAPPGAAVELIRVERERVAQRMLIHPPGDPPPDAGIREPRRPQPSAGGAAAIAYPPDA